MKKILALTVLTGIVIGRNLKTSPAEYLTVNMQVAQYEAEKPLTVPTITVPEVQAMEATESGEIEPEEPQISDKVGSMLEYIHQAESSSGKNNTPGALHLLCRSKGKWNELGYGGMRLKICFDSEEEGMNHVADWLERHLEKFEGDVAKTLCYYNLGIEEINCKYYQGYVGTL